MRAHRPIAVVVRFALVVLVAPAVVRAAAAMPTARFTKGETTAKALNQGETLFTNSDNKIADGPAEVMGLQFTCRPTKTTAEATLDAPAGTTAYVLTNSKATIALCEKDGWSRVKPDVHFADDTGQPISNPSVRPLVEDWIRLTQAVDALQSRGGSQQAVERQRQTLLDEMAREQSDADVMQKMLKEGM